MTTSYVRWGEATVKLTWKASNHLPDAKLKSSSPYQSLITT